MARWHVAPLRFAPAFRALRVCEHTLPEVWATLLSPKWAEIFVARLAGDEMSLPRELIYNGYIFQPVALEVQGYLGQSSEIFITRLCKMLCRSHDDQRVASFLKQRISMALQFGNAACVLGTVSDRDAFDEIYYI